MVLMEKCSTALSSLTGIFNYFFVNDFKLFSVKIETELILNDN